MSNNVKLCVECGEPIELDRPVWLDREYSMIEASGECVGCGKKYKGTFFAHFEDIEAAD